MYLSGALSDYTFDFDVITQFTIHFSYLFRFRATARDSAHHQYIEEKEGGTAPDRIRSSTIGVGRWERKRVSEGYSNLILKSTVSLEITTVPVGSMQIAFSSSARNKPVEFGVAIEKQPPRYRKVRLKVLSITLGARVEQNPFTAELAAMTYTLRTLVGLKDFRITLIRVTKRQLSH